MLDLIQRWYMEAVSLHGDDWPNIERYVQRKLAAISQEDRLKLFSAFEALFPCETGLPN